MASPAATAASKLQLLADALAAEFSESRASAACAAALARLLPGIQYLRCAPSMFYGAKDAWSWFPAMSEAAMACPATKREPHGHCTILQLAVDRLVPLRLARAALV